MGVSMGLRARDAAAFDGRLADPVLEPERRAPGRQLVAVLTPDHLDAGHVLVGAAGPVEQRLQALGVGGEDGDRHMDVRGAQRRLPPVRAAVSHIAQLGGASGHALAELGREALQGGLGHTERLEALVGERHGDPRVRGRATRGLSGADQRTQASQQLPAGLGGRRCAPADRLPRRGTGVRG